MVPSPIRTSTPSSIDRLSPGPRSPLKFLRTRRGLTAREQEEEEASHAQNEIRKYFLSLNKNKDDSDDDRNDQAPRHEEAWAHDGVLDAYSAVVYRQPVSEVVSKPEAEVQRPFPERRDSLPSFNGHRKHAESSQESGHAQFSPPLLRASTEIDPSLVPMPLKVSTLARIDRAAAGDKQSQQSPSLLEDDCVIMSAAIDTQGSCRKSLMMSMFEKQTAVPQKPISTLLDNSAISDSPSKPVVGHESRRRESGEAVIYFLPSSPPSSRSPSAERSTKSVSNILYDRQPEETYLDERPHLPLRISEKAQRILGCESPIDDTHLLNPGTLNTHLFHRPISQLTCILRFRQGSPKTCIGARKAFEPDKDIQTDSGDSPRSQIVPKWWCNAGEICDERHTQ